MSAVNAILEADPRYVRLPSVLQLCENEMYTGYIMLIPGGRIALSAGQPVGAQTDDGYTGIAALQELFFIEDAKLQVVLDDAVRGTPLGPSIALVMDACKVQDDWIQLAQERWVEAEGAEPHPKLEEVRPLLSHMARGDSLDVAFGKVRRRGFALSRESILSCLTYLIDEFMVEATDVLPEPQKIGGIILDENVDPAELVLQARIFVKDGAYNEAEALLMHALELRPNDRVISQNLRHVAMRRQAAGL